MTSNKVDRLHPTPARFAKIIDFQAHFKIAGRLQGKHQWSHISFTPQASDPHSRLAVVASKKAVDKRAVRRNRAKRRLRPLMKKIATTWCQSTIRSDQGAYSLQWVIRPKASAVQINAKELEADVQNTFDKLVAQLKPRPSGENGTPKVML